MHADGRYRSLKIKILTRSMCYDLNASIRSSVIGMVSSIALYLKGNTTLGLFFIFVTLMQVYDWIFWINQEENRVNYITTKIAMISNHLQPIVLALLVGNLDKVSTVVLFAYIAAAVVYSSDAYNKISYTLVNRKSYPSLYWEWNDLPWAVPFYSLFLLSFMVTCRNLPAPTSYILMALNAITFMFSYYTYKESTVGKGWCYIAAYVPLLFQGNLEGILEGNLGSP